MRHDADAVGVYTTPLLADFRLQVSVFWQEPLPNPIEIVATVKAMLATDN
ncbi:MAG: hypothetical protein KC519_23495 [Anaerolineae bacterium]|nr:hypothetical protein [Anaerolineae bacterium]